MSGELYVYTSRFSFSRLQTLNLGQPWPKFESVVAKIEKLEAYGQRVIVCQREWDCFVKVACMNVKNNINSFYSFFNKRDVTGWLKNYRASLRTLSPPLYLAINFVIAGQNMTSDDIMNVTNNLDAVMDEAGFTQWGEGLNDEPTWLNILNYMELLQASGKAYLNYTCTHTYVHNNAHTYASM